MPEAIRPLPQWVRDAQDEYAILSADCKYRGLNEHDARQIRRMYLLAGMLVGYRRTTGGDTSVTEHPPA